jgi:DNA-binding transcriptional ArsR family regulator
MDVARSGDHATAPLDSYIAIWLYRHMTMYSDDALSLTFSALADPTRRAMLSRLAKGAADVSELAKPFGLSQPTISKHLKVLERAGLVARSQDAQRRPRTLVAKPLRAVDRWLDGYRQLWESRFAGLDDYLARLPEAVKSAPARPSGHAKRRRKK